MGLISLQYLIDISVLDMRLLGKAKGNGRIYNLPPEKKKKKKTCRNYFIPSLKSGVSSEIQLQLSAVKIRR